MRHQDNAPVGYTCPDVDRVIETIAGVADRLNAISDRLCCDALENDCNEIAELSGTLNALFKGRQSPIEILRSANEALRDWGNEEVERADNAEAECKALERRIGDLEVM